MNSTSSEPTEPAPKPARPQFSMWTMFLVVTGLGVALGLLRAFLVWGGVAGGVMFALFVVYLGLLIAILRGSKSWVVLVLLFFVLLILLLAALGRPFPAMSAPKHVPEQPPE